MISKVSQLFLAGLMGIQAQLFLTILLAIFNLFALPHSMADYVMYTGEVLTAGQNLTNGQYQLSMRSNCDLVLHDGEKPVWRSNTSGQGHESHDCYLALKNNGELVVRRNVHYTLWSSGSKSKKGKYAVVLEGNGKLSLYGQRRWVTSNHKEVGHVKGSVVPTEYVMYSGHRLTLAKKLEYKNYEMSLNRCNLAISDTQTGRTLWQTNTQNSRGCYLQLESTGELNLMRGGQRLWSSNKRSDSGVYMGVLRFDGRLAVYGPLLWCNIKTDDSKKSDKVVVRETLNIHRPHALV